MIDQPLNLDEIAARAAAATRGPWGTHRDLSAVYTVQARPRTTQYGMETDGDVAVLAVGRTDAESYANARFIAHAREDVDALLAEVRRLRAERDRFADRVDTLTAVAKGNKRHVQEMFLELQKAQAEINRSRARTLTESEHNRAWHAIEGAAGEEGADPGTVLNAVLRALDLNPPAARSAAV